MTMPFGQWFSRLKPVFRNIPAENNHLRADSETSADAVALRESLSELRSRTDELQGRLERVESIPDGTPEIEAPSLATVQQQLDGMRLQHDSLLASLHESAATYASHASRIEEIRARLEKLESSLGAIGNADDLRDQLAAAGKLRVETENKLTEISNSVKKLQATMTGVVQASEISREAYLARDNARIAEAQRDRKALWALVGVSLILAAAAMLIALRALGVRLPN